MFSMMGPFELLFIIVAIALMFGLGVGVWVLIRRLTEAGDDDE